MELYPSVKPLKVEKPNRDKQKAWHPKGMVRQDEYERKKFQEAFKK